MSKKIKNFEKSYKLLERKTKLHLKTIQRRYLNSRGHIITSMEAAAQILIIVTGPGETQFDTSPLKKHGLG